MSLWQRIRRNKLRVKRWLYRHVPLYRKLYIRSPFWRRASYGVVSVFIVFLSILLQNLGSFFSNNNYELSAQALKLIGEVRDDASEYLKINEGQTGYEFAVPEKEEGASSHTGRIDDAFSAYFSVDPKQGVTVTEKNTQLPIKLVPKFYVGKGKQVEGSRIIYPFGANQLVYSLKYNGLKEDIVVPKYISEELDYSFELVLPAGADARLDENGDIGIYTSDTTLFGNIIYGSEDDRALVEKARENSDKNHLILTIPAPIIKDSNGVEYKDRSVFKLSEKKQRIEEVQADESLPEEVKDKQKATYNVYGLTIASTRLKDLAYPISIDPTMQVTSASDFAGVNLDTGVEIDYTNGLIRRGELTGGVVNAWSTTTAMHNTRLGHGVVVSNGYIYYLGGDAGNGTDAYSTDVRYGRLNSNGTIAADSGCGSAWCATTSLSTGRRFLNATSYNGYIYVAGGQTSSNAYVNTVHYAKINDNGTLGNWASTANLTSIRRQSSFIAYQGYLYMQGGATSGGVAMTTSEYAKLNADGSIASNTGCGSSWCSTSQALPAGRIDGAAMVSNGWLYFVGGRNGSGTSTNAVLYAQIGSDGNLGSWLTASSMNTARHNAHATIYNGYAYAIGGCTNIPGGLCSAFLSSVEYAPINANGSLGTWRTTKSLNTARSVAGSVSWNGFLYILGGCTSGNCTYTDTVEYASITPAGELHDGGWTSTTVFPTNIREPGSVVYNGYIYAVGGISGVTYSRNVRYAALNADGTIGSWTTITDSLIDARSAFGLAVHNGYLYAVAGRTSGSFDIDTVEYAAINTNGSLGTWTSTSTLPDTRRNLGVVAYNGYIYAIGGSSSDSDRPTLRASINNDGSLGSWTSLGNGPIRTGLGGNTHVYNGRIYLVGGCTSSCPGTGSEDYDLYVTIVQYADINSDGSLGSWQDTTADIGYRSAQVSTIYNGYMYVSGGYNTAAPEEVLHQDVIRAPILADGSVGSFEATTSLGAHWRDHVMIGHAGYLYVLTGRTSSSGSSNRTAYIPVNNGGAGSVSTFAAGTTFNGTRKNHTSIAYNGYVYVLGGCTNAACSTATNGVRYAPINSDGSLGAWADTGSNFTTARYNLSVFIYNGRMYVAGGRNTAGTGLTDIQYNSIASGGNISGSWTTDNTSLPSVGYGAGMAVANNTLYVVGGSSSLTTTRYAAINTSTGDIGSFTSTSVLPQGRHSSAVVIYKGYIYTIGGYNGSELHTVYYAPLNSDNTIGTWRNASSLNNKLRFDAQNSAFATNGYLYVAGGHDGAGSYNFVQFAAIGASGDLGAWQRSIGSGLGTGGNHTGYGVAEWKGRIYVTGGFYTSNDTSAISRYASLQLVPRLGIFSKKYDFGSGVKPGKFITRGTKQTGSIVSFEKTQNFNCGALGFLNPQSSSDITFGQSGMIDIDISGQTQVSCLLIKYTIDDQKSAVFPDTGNSTYISSFDLYFTANPGSRLRGGRSFINGQSRGLEANPR